MLTGHAALSQAAQKCLRNICTRQVTETILHHLSPEPISTMPCTYQAAPAPRILILNLAMETRLRERPPVVQNSFLSDAACPDKTHHNVKIRGEGGPTHVCMHIESRIHKVVQNCFRHLYATMSLV